MNLITLWPAVAGAAPIAVVKHDGTPHVAADALEREAGIAIKRLPGRGGFVACGAEACAPVKSAALAGDVLLVPVVELTEAMNLTAHFDDNHRHVIFSPKPRRAAGAAEQARVGSVVPNLRLTKLDGGTVTLDELRGQRVLINSWASW